MNKKKMSDKTKKKVKKAIVLGAAFAGTALLTIGGIYVYKHKDILDKEIKLGRKNVNFIRKSGTFDYLDVDINAFSGSNVNINKSYNDLKNLDLQMIKSINSENEGKLGCSTNCVHCTLAYIGNSLFGKKWKALPFDGIDETSGLVTQGRNANIFFKLFNNVKQYSYNENNLKDVLNKIPKGSVGALGMRNIDGSGHIINYEKSLLGKIRLIDTQNNIIIDSFSRVGKNQIEFLSKSFTGESLVYDFTNASLKDNIDDILKYLIK